MRHAIEINRPHEACFLYRRMVQFPGSGQPVGLRHVSEWTTQGTQSNDAMSETSANNDSPLQPRQIGSASQLSTPPGLAAVAREPSRELGCLAVHSRELGSSGFNWEAERNRSVQRERSS